MLVMKLLTYQLLDGSITEISVDMKVLRRLELLFQMPVDL